MSENDPISSAKTAIEVVGAVMKDAAADPQVSVAAHELGKTAVTLTKAINTLSTAFGRDELCSRKARRYFEQRFSVDFEEVARRIPADQIVEPRPSIAGSILQVRAFNPLQPYITTEDANLARMSINKEFHGDLQATSRGEMLAATMDIKDSAGLVAIERVTGALHGRRGSFVLQHNATMTRGIPYLNIVVVPDSGTDELTGLTGHLTITIADGKHSRLPDSSHKARI